MGKAQLVHRLAYNDDIVAFKMGPSASLFVRGGIAGEKSSSPTKQVERKGRTKSGPLILMRFVSRTANLHISHEGVSLACTIEESTG